MPCGCAPTIRIIVNTKVRSKIILWYIMIHTHKKYRVLHQVLLLYIQNILCTAAVVLVHALATNIIWYQNNPRRYGTKHHDEAKLPNSNCFEASTYQVSSWVHHTNHYASKYILVVHTVHTRVLRSTSYTIIYCTSYVASHTPGSSVCILPVNISPAQLLRR